MGAPTPEVYQDGRGRRGQATFKAVWTQSDSDNLDNEIVLDVDSYVSGDYTSTRYAVDTVEWTSSSSVSGDLEFDSAPAGPGNIIVSVPTDVTAGEIDFSAYPDGCKADPNRNSPGNVVFTSRNALPGDEVFFSITYREKGKRA